MPGFAQDPKFDEYSLITKFSFLMSFLQPEIFLGRVENLLIRVQGTFSICYMIRLYSMIWYNNNKLKILFVNTVWVQYRKCPIRYSFMKAWVTWEQTLDKLGLELNLEFNMLVFGKEGCHNSGIIFWQVVNISNVSDSRLRMHFCNHVVHIFCS